MGDKVEESASDDVALSFLEYEEASNDEQASEDSDDNIDKETVAENVQEAKENLSEAFAESVKMLAGEEPPAETEETSSATGAENVNGLPVAEAEDEESTGDVSAETPGDDAEGDEESEETLSATGAENAEAEEDEAQSEEGQAEEDDTENDTDEESTGDVSAETPGDDAEDDGEEDAEF